MDGWKDEWMNGCTERRGEGDDFNVMKESDKEGKEGISKGECDKKREMDGELRKRVIKGSGKKEEGRTS